MDTGHEEGAAGSGRPVRIKVKKVRGSSGRGTVVEERIEDGRRVRVVRRRRPSRRRRRRLLRRAGLAVVIVLGVGALWGVLAIGPAFRARADLLAGREALVRARSQLSEGTLSEATRSFTDARNAFAKATNESGSLAIRAAGLLPFLGRTPDAVAQMSEGGELIAQAGLDISEVVARMPGGAAALAPTHGVFPLGRYPPLAGALSRARIQAAAGVGRISEASSTWVIPQIARARQEALDQVGDLPSLFGRAGAVLGRMPAFLGADGPRRYFVGAQSPAEMRGTGGFLGAYSILTVDQGRFSFSAFRTIADLADFPPSAIRAPNPSYARNYNQFGGAGFWRNINMTPDFPSAAVAIERLFKKDTGIQVDGVMAADPAMLADLLRVTGPVASPELGVTLTADNVVPYITNTAYLKFGTSDLRKPLLGDAASRIFDRFIGAAKPSLGMVEAVASAASGGHLLLYSDDSATERILVQTGAAGALAPPGGDLLGIIQNNAAANKIDYYEHRSVTYDVRLLPGGVAAGRADVRLGNSAPSTGPAYVLGPYNVSFKTGESASFFTVYCGRNCGLDSATRGGRPEPLQSGEELGYPSFQDYVRIPSGGTAELGYELRTNGAWTGTDRSGTYRLTFLNQPTIHPTAVHLTITAPPGTRVVGASEGMVVSGATATWQGTPGRTLTLDVRFATRESLSQRVWRFLNHPLFHL